MATLIEGQGLSKQFGALKALDRLDFRWDAGRIIGLLGPNGSGKTTLLKLMNGLLSPTEGHVRIEGQLPGVTTKQIISYLPERTYLNEWMTVNRIIDFFADFYQDFNRQKAEGMMVEMDIDPTSRLKTLSKGTKEKVQLALVMAREAKIYLLDEPIGGVDPAARDFILDTILQKYNPGATIVISTHLITDVERIFDDIVFLQKGRIVLQGDVDEIRAREEKSIDALFREVFRC